MAKKAANTAKKAKNTKKPATAKSSKKYVYFFGNGKADGDRSMRDTLGGKGAGQGDQAIDRLSFSARGYHRVLEMARTIADLADMDARLEIPAIPAPKAEFATAEEAIEDAYNAELGITKNIHDLLSQAIDAQVPSPAITTLAEE